MITFERAYHRWLGVAALPAGVAALSFASGLRAEDAPAPIDEPVTPVVESPYDTEQTTRIVVHITDIDPKKVESAAASLLRKKTPGLSLAEAKAQLRVNGKLDIARCLEEIYPAQLGKVSVGKVDASVVANFHEEPAQ